MHIYNFQFGILKFIVISVIREILKVLKEELFRMSENLQIYYNHPRRNCPLSFCRASFRILFPEVSLQSSPICLVRGSPAKKWISFLYRSRVRLNEKQDCDFDYGLENNDLREHRDFVHSDCITKSMAVLPINSQKTFKNPCSYLKLFDSYK